MSRSLLIVHPRANRRKHGDLLLRHLAKKFDLSTRESNYPGQTRELAREFLSEGKALLFTAGGDGTLHEALNGWADLGFPPGARFVPLPLGTGNDFLGSIDARLTKIQTYLTCPLTQFREADLGKVTYQSEVGEQSRYFCVGATAGFSAVVTARRAELATRIPGHLSYLLALFLSFAFWQNRSLRVESEEAPISSDVFLNFNAANVKHYGGGMISAPAADPFDGALNAVSMNLTLKQALRALPENFRGRFERIKNVEQSLLSKPFSVDCQPLCPVQADGELLGQTPMRIECLPGKLPIILPSLPDQ